MTSQQLLCDASCFERIARSNASAEELEAATMLVVVEDLESSPSSQEQEQKTDHARQTVSTLILTKSFWIGVFAGLLLQLVTFSAFLMLFLRSGKNPQHSVSAPLSYWTLYMLLHMDIPFYTLIWAGFFMALTKGVRVFAQKV